MVLLGGSKGDHIAAIVELHIVLTADLDTVNGIVKAIQRQRQSSLSLDTASLAEIMNLIEVVGIAGLLSHTFQMCLTIDLDTHFEIPHFTKFRVRFARHTFAMRV